MRDLAWTIQSPGLLDPAYKQYQPSPGGDGAARPVAAVIDDGWCERQFLQHRQWLRGLDADPRGLIEWLKPHYDSFGKPLSNPRLGYYFESLVEFWLRYGCAYQPLIAHLPVKDAQRTVGEFDYLFMDSARQAVQHWEVAVKFYLHHEDANGRILWYGPNPRDRLDLKLQRFFYVTSSFNSGPDFSGARRQPVANIFEL